LFQKALHVRPLQLPTYTTFELLGAYINCSALKIAAVVIYRPGSQQVTETFFNEFCVLLERVVIFATPLVILGDFNIHVDDALDPQRL
jgi:hypothetical protein